MTAASVADGDPAAAATVAKLLKALAHAGMVDGDARRRRRLSPGARAATAISVAEVVAAIDGDIGLTQCSVHVAECARTNYCPTRPHWAAINRAVGTALSAVIARRDDLARPPLCRPRRGGQHADCDGEHSPHERLARYPDTVRSLQRGLQIRLRHRYREPTRRRPASTRTRCASSRPRRASRNGCSTGGSQAFRAWREDGRRRTGPSSTSRRSTTRPRPIIRRRKQNAGPKSLDEVDPELLRDLRKARHSAARARGAGRRRGRRGVRQRLGGDDLQGAARRARHHLLLVRRGGARAPRSRAQLSRHGRAAERQFLRGAQFRGVQRRLLRLHPAGRALPDGALAPISASTPRRAASSSARS